MKRFFRLLIIICVVHISYAQDLEITSKNTSTNVKEFRFSIFFGWPFGFAKNDIEDAMISSGFDDQSPPSWFGSGNSHPFTRTYPVFDLELTYFLNENSGVSLNGGMGDNIEVLGYDTQGSFLFIKSEVWSGSLNYVYRSKNNRHTGYIGPTLIFYNATRTSSESDDGYRSYDVNKFGFYTGYTYNILQKRVFIMAFKFSVRWAGSADIGPFYARGYGENVLEFPETAVNLTTFNIGLSFGFRNGKRN